MTMRILVATDGSPAALGALHVAAALGRDRGAVVEVISAVDPIPVGGILYGGAVGLASWQMEEAARTGQRANVEEQLAAVGSGASEWPLTVEVGPAAPTIVRAAQAFGATMIVLGLGRHALADRWFGTETALMVVRLAHVPVLAVPADARALPARAVAAVDFTDFSDDAARLARDLLPAGGALELVHVFWRPSEEVSWVGGRDWIVVQRDRARKQLEEAARQLAAEGVEVRPHLLEGDPPFQTLRLGKALGAGLVAVGSHGAGFLGRALMGSVSTRVIRGAECMVLVAPPREVAVEIERLPEPDRGRIPAGTLFSDQPEQAR